MPHVLTRLRLLHASRQSVGRSAAAVLAGGCWWKLHSVGVTRTHGRLAREGEDVAEGVQDMHAPHGGGGEFFLLLQLPQTPTLPFFIFKQTHLFSVETWDAHP